MQKVTFGHSALAVLATLLMTVLCKYDLADGKTSVTLTAN